MNVILNQVKYALAETLNLKTTDDIQMETRLKDDLGLDSMSSLTFLMALENNINGFVIDPDTLEADHLLTVNSIISFIQTSISNEQHLEVIQ